MSELDRAARILGWVSGYVLDRPPEQHEIPSPTQFDAFVSLVHVSPKWIVTEHDTWKAHGAMPPHPLEKAVRAWLGSQTQTDPNVRSDRILPARLGMVAPSHPQAGSGLFTPAARADNNWQQRLPGFGFDGSLGPSLPHELYDLGAGRGRRYTPLALRIWIEGVLCVPLEYRGRDHPVSMSMVVRNLLSAIYPSRRKPRPAEYWGQLMAAADALDSREARVPWEDPTTKRGGLRRVVSLSDLPRSPLALDDLISLIVHLPPGAEDGPLVSPNLAWWGLKSPPAYRALIGLAYRWHKPGLTRRPVRRDKKHWELSQNPAYYPRITDADLVELCFPTSANAARRNLVGRSRNVIKRLADSNELRILDGGRKLLPPKRNRDRPSNECR